VQLPLLLGSAVVAVGLVALASVLLDLSFERAALLAPLIVLAVGAAVALVVLWARVALDPVIRRRREQRGTREGRAGGW
jgi:hypothetical protein